MNQISASLTGKDKLNSLVARLLDLWPEHEGYCISRFEDNSPEFLDRTEEFCSLVYALAGDNLDQYLADYRWMCEEFLKEEVYFRRKGTYRLSTFADAYREVYGKQEYMSRYVRGILISQIIWRPHAEAFDLFRTEFLARLPENSRYLEVGPGHGLFLYYASQQKTLSELVAWDVSDSSIQATTKALDSLGVTKPIKLVNQDVLVASSQPDSFDGAVISEVLEHLEDPKAALKTLHESLKTGGQIFINVPINSPAPDHIYLWRSTEEFTEFVESVGFSITQAHFLPVTGATLERAIKQDLSISCVLIAEKV